MKGVGRVLGVLVLCGLVLCGGTSPAQEPSPPTPPSEELGLEQVPISPENIVNAEGLEASGGMWGWVIASILAGAGLIAGISWMTLRRFGDRIHLPLTVNDLPGSARLAVTLILLFFGLVHLFGMTTAYIMSSIVNASAPEYFFYMKIGKLTGMTHAHLFGTSVMHLVVALSFLLTTVRERWKVILIAATLLGSPIDYAAWWLIKYVSPLFEGLALAGEVTSEVGYLTMTLITLVQLWRTPETKGGKG
ncbi:MAG: hypothetical protein HZA19_01215 [Nitrospirae bacterium]|nr:hypothetical protein [Nitrospirota bacterium]